MLKNKTNRTDTEFKHNTIVGAKALSYSCVSGPKVGVGGFYHREYRGPKPLHLTHGTSNK